MPSQVYDDGELAQREKLDLKNKIESLSLEVKKWRRIAKILRDGGTVPPGDLDDLEASETQKRREELKRIKPILKGMIDKVDAADPTLPLLPQLGFDTTIIA